MVASEATTLACRSLKLDSVVNRAEKLTKMVNKPNLSREVKLQRLHRFTASVNSIPAEQSKR